MQVFLLVLHILVGIALVGAILVQKSEGGGLVSGGGMGGMMTARGSANFLTRLTAILATTFIALCILQAIVASHSKPKHSILEETSVPVIEAPAVPAVPLQGETPQVPAS